MRKVARFIVLVVLAYGPRRHRLCQNEVVADLTRDRPWNRLAELACTPIAPLLGAAESFSRNRLRKDGGLLQGACTDGDRDRGLRRIAPLARILRSFGHEVKLIAPQLVKPYVKRGKNDTADAEALCEAMSLLDDALRAGDADLQQP